MREITAYMLLSEADALVFGALIAFLIEIYFQGAFSNPLLAALLALIAGTVILPLIFYLHNVLWYDEFTLKGLGKDSGTIYSFVSALDVMAFTILCIFVLPSISDHYGVISAVAAGMVLFIIAMAIQCGMWTRIINGTLSAHRLLGSQIRWGTTGYLLTIGMDMLCGGLLGGLPGVAAGTLLGWAPLFVQMFYSTQRSMEYRNKFSTLFFPAIISFDMSLFFVTAAIWYFNGLGVPLTTIGLIYSALIIVEIAAIMALYRAGLLKIVPKKLDGPIAQAH